MYKHRGIIIIRGYQISWITQYYTAWPTSEIKTPTWSIFFYIPWKHQKRDFKRNHVMW